MHDTTASEIPASLGRQAARVACAINYLHESFNVGRQFAILTGGAPGDIRLAMHRFLSALPPSARVSRLPSPIDSSEEFLRSLLGEFRQESTGVTGKDMQSLLSTIAEESGAPAMPRRVLIVPDAQDFGPRVLDTLCEMVRGLKKIARPPLLVLTGHAGLNRVLDSPGMVSMASLTCVRWHIDDAGTAAVLGAALDAPAASLALTREHEVMVRFPVDRDRVLIGRSPLSDICLPGRFVSRQHALLLQTSEGPWLIDLKSTNGTIVNADPIRQVRINDGDVISIGSHRLRYEHAGQRGLASPHLSTEDDRLGDTVVMDSLDAGSGPGFPSEAELPAALSTSSAA